MRARLKQDRTDDEPHGKCKPCGRPRYRTCDEITPFHIATSSNGTIVRLIVNSDRKTMNVVYLISCGGCGKQYVQKIKGQHSLRMNGHRDDWRHSRFEISPVAKHFCLPGHNFMSHASVCCLDHGSDGQDQKTA